MGMEPTLFGGLVNLIAEKVQRLEQQIHEKDRQIEELKAKLAVYEKKESILNKISEYSNVNTRSEHAD